MAPKVFEGTIAEIQNGLSKAYSPEQRLRAVVIERPAAAEPPTEPFHPAGFRNGVPLLPRRQTAEPVTLELVKRILDEADVDTLRAD